MLHERSRPIHIQRLQSVADAKHGLCARIGILQQQLVHRFSFGVSGRGLLVAIRAILLRIDIRPAAGQQNARRTARSVPSPDRGVCSSSMRTGSPPAPRTAASYCGSERSRILAIARNAAREWQSAGPRLCYLGSYSTHPLDPCERFALPVVSNFHPQQTAQTQSPQQ